MAGGQPGLSRLTPALMLSGYAQGVFPMAMSRDDDQLHWFDPPMRGVLPLDGFHASRSLCRTLRRGGWRATLNHDFPATVRACANREETWINAALFDLYDQLHAAGFAHSLEVWQDDQPAGAVFGLTLGGAFFGESMVSQRRDGSKMALLWAVSHLSDCGFTLFDTQYLTPHLASLGGMEIPRAAYHARLNTALSHDADPTAHPLPTDQGVLQRISQIS